jgi:UDP-2,3-diacylglucosamine pyrophosphatase LpxH
VRTLVISDLHLGARLRLGVLTRPAPLERLLAALDGVDRLVLLGDIVELMERRGHAALATAEPVLRAIGERVGAQREVILVPGNHDWPLVSPWVRTQAATLTPDTRIPLDATATLAAVTSWLEPARVSAHYPGVWLSERVWATHGHYLDRHLLPESAFGIARGLLGRLPRAGAVPADYELAGGVSLTRLEALMTRSLPRPLASLVEDLAELLRAATMPRVPRRLMHPRLAPLAAMLLGLQMRRASIPAVVRVVRRLGVDADWVLFGHVHRLGPLMGDKSRQWQGFDGRPRVLNTGSWVYEPLLVHNAAPPHPYWPGGAVVMEDGREPVVAGLLDDLDVEALTAG